MSFYQCSILTEQQVQQSKKKVREAFATAAAAKEWKTILVEEDEEEPEAEESIEEVEDEGDDEGQVEEGQAIGVSKEITMDDIKRYVYECNSQIEKYLVKRSYVHIASLECKPSFWRIHMNTK